MFARTIPKRSVTLNFLVTLNSRFIFRFQKVFEVLVKEMEVRKEELMLKDDEIECILERVVTPRGP